MIPPTIGELVSALPHCREGFATIGGAAPEDWAVVALMARFDTLWLDSILERIDTPPEVNQPEGAKKRERDA